MWDGLTSDSCRFQGQRSHFHSAPLGVSLAAEVETVGTVAPLFMTNRGAQRPRLRTPLARVAQRFVTVCRLHTQNHTQAVRPRGAPTVTRGRVLWLALTLPRQPCHCMSLSGLRD